MAIEEVSARDIGCTGTLVIPPMPPHRTAPGSARPSDKSSRPMSAAASEADTRTSMAEALIGTKRTEAAGGRSSRHRPGKVTPRPG
ncbi:hypothetical protein V5F01_04845 [Streptomyces sp. NRRL B-2790]|uniref:hypothetical protein n=1 Tax=Streptomyces sp. NRRL B-2790 TaxID=1463835 RepID=UPI0035647AFC